MSGAVFGRTPNIGLGLIEFNFPNWADDANDNSSIIDGVMSVIGVSVKGAWANGTPYAPGDLLIDAAVNTMYRCLIAHMSAASGTFAADRAANPTYWQAATTSLHARGQWATATTYYTNDIVYKDANQYSWALVTRQYTSSTSYDSDVFAANLVVITNTEKVVTDANTARDQAAASATSASTSASSATSSASSATLSASNASASAATATTQAGNASGFAQSASNAALAASGYASSAQTSANSADQSEALAASYASSAANSLAQMIPDAPADNQTYGRRNHIWSQVADTSLPEAPFTGVVYGRKNGTWVDAASGSASAAATYVGDGPPASPIPGQLWWETDTGNLFIYYNDGNTQQWVLAVPAAGPPGGPGPPGGLGEAPSDGNFYGRKSSAWVNGWASPVLTGTPIAPTPLTADSSTSVATTAFVKAQGYITSAPADDVIGGIITIGNTAPAFPAINDVWIDTT